MTRTRGNIFDILGVDDSGAARLRAASWLMDPKAGHGWKDRILRGFVGRIVNREFGAGFPESGWARAAVRRKVRAGGAAVDVVIRHPRGFAIGLSDVFPPSVPVRKAADYWRVVERMLRKRSVMLYMAPWYEMPVPKGGGGKARPFRMKLASCGTNYMTWVLRDFLKEVCRKKAAGKKDPLVLTLAEDLCEVLVDQAARERCSEHDDA